MEGQIFLNNFEGPSLQGCLGVAFLAAIFVGPVAVKTLERRRAHKAIRNLRFHLACGNVDTDLLSQTNSVLMKNDFARNAVLLEAVQNQISSRQLQ